MRIRKNQKIQSSLLDKLLDDAPEEKNLEKQFSITLHQLKNSVKRDLQNLLNSKIRWHIWPEYYTELDCSLLNYGLPDFSDSHAGTEEGRIKLCKQIEQTIRYFEPRFIEVEVFPQVNDKPEDRTLRIQINALLYADPEPEAICFNSEIEPVNLGLKIQDSI